MSIPTYFPAPLKLPEAVLEAVTASIRISGLAVCPEIWTEKILGFMENFTSCDNEPIVVANELIGWLLSSHPTNKNHHALRTMMDYAALAYCSSQGRVRDFKKSIYS